jgi:hypothetical protein
MLELIAHTKHLYPKKHARAQRQNLPRLSHEVAHGLPLRFQLLRLQLDGVLGRFRKGVLIAG